MAEIPATVVNGPKQLALRAAAQDDTVKYAPGRCLVVANASAGAVEVRAPQNFDSSPTSDDAIATVPAAQTHVVPLSARYAGTNGDIDLSYDSVASVTVGVIDFPRVGRVILNN